MCYCFCSDKKNILKQEGLCLLGSSLCELLLYLGGAEAHSPVEVFSATFKDKHNQIRCCLMWRNDSLGNNVSHYILLCCVLLCKRKVWGYGEHSRIRAININHIIILLCFLGKTLEVKCCIITKLSYLWVWKKYVLCCKWK